MKLKWHLVLLNWLFINLLFFYLLSPSLESADLRDILKEPEVKSNSSDRYVDANGLRLTQTVLQSLPKKSAYYSQPVTFIAYVVPTRIPGTIPTGSVKFEINQLTVGTQPLINGIAKFTTSDLTPTHLTQHYISAIYLGDKTNAPSKDNLNFSVFPSDTTTSLRSNFNPSLFGRPVNFTVDVVSNEPAVATPTGLVQFQLDGNYITKVELNAKGQATFSSSEIPTGTHIITAIYQENEKFNESRGELEQQIDKALSTTQLDSMANPSIFGQSVVFIAKVSSEVEVPSGKVQFRLNEENYGNPFSLDSNGQAKVTIQNLTSGNHHIEAYYLGNEHLASSANFLNQQIYPAPTKAELTSTVNPAVYNHSIGITAKIISDNLQPSGLVQFKIDGKEVYDKPRFLPRSGQVSLIIDKLKAGTHQIQFDYLGSKNFNPSHAILTQQIEKASTETIISSLQNPSVYNDKPLKIIAKVVAKDLKPVGLIQFKLNGENFEEPKTLLKDSNTTVVFNQLNAGSYKIEAEYLGSENFNPSHAILTQQIEKASTETIISSSQNPSVYNDKPLKIIAKVVAKDLKPVGLIQFKLNGENFEEPKTLLKDSHVTVVFDQLNAGSYKIEAEYLGNENFNPSHYVLVQQINKKDTSASIISSNNPSLFGEPVTFTAKVFANEPLEGEVQFQIDGVNIGNPVKIDENNQSSITLSSELKKGEQEVVAVYSGSKNFNSSVSPSLLQTTTLTILPPVKAKGFQVANPIKTEDNFINILRWEAPESGASPVVYRVYRDPELKDFIAEIPANEELEFIDSSREKTASYQYFVVSVDNWGNESEPVSIKIEPSSKEEEQQQH